MFQSETRYCHADGVQVSEHNRHSTPSSGRKANSGSNHTQAIGSNGFMHLPCPFQQTTYASNTAVSTSYVETKYSSAESYNNDSSSFNSTSKMVDESGKFLQRSSVTGASLSTDIDHRRIRTRMGSPSGELGDFRTLAPRIQEETHKLVGIKSSTISPARSFTSDKGESNSSEIRQYNSDQLHKQAGGDTLCRIVLPDMGAVPVVHSIQHCIESCADSREKELSCRCTFPREENSHDRMVTKQHNSEYVISPNGDSQHRSICKSSEQEVASLLLSIPRHQCFSSRCVINKLERDVCLCISSNSHSKSITEDSRRNEHCSAHRSNVAKTVLVSSDDRTPDQGSNKTTTVAGSIIS